MNNEVDTFLEHFGVKGQRWGVRNKKDKKPLTNAELKKRKQKRADITTVGVSGVILGGLILSHILAARGATKVKNINVYKPASVVNLINNERNTQLSSLKRMHQEGKMNADQAKNFIKLLNARYDRKIAEAI